MKRNLLEMVMDDERDESKFKFIFEDSQTSIVNGKDYREAAILVAANRIRAKKNGAWAQSGKNWEVVKQDSVTLQLS